MTTPADPVETALLRVLPASASRRVAAGTAADRVREHLPAATDRDVTAALLRLEAAGRVLRTTRANQERWYRCGPGAENTAPATGPETLFG